MERARLVVQGLRGFWSVDPSAGEEIARRRREDVWSGGTAEKGGGIEEEKEERNE